MSISSSSPLPISVVIVTKNEERRITACLRALSDFDDVWVVDSHSADQTRSIAEQHGAQVVDYIWNDRYPKKRGWCLGYLELKYDFIFFVDADEIVPPALLKELRALDFQAAGYFIRGHYIWNNKTLRFGLTNNKLALFNRHRFEFPIIDDLKLSGMGEIEGHYQPVLKAAYKSETIGQTTAPLLHIMDQSWSPRHKRYAIWEAGMNARKSWPVDPRPLRQAAKQLFRHLPFRGACAFLHCYIFKLGFLDGRAGFDFARSRWRYYRMISDASIDLARLASEPISAPEYHKS